MLWAFRRFGAPARPKPRESPEKVIRAKALIASAQATARETEHFDARLDLELAELALKRMVFDAEYTFNGKTTAAQQPDAGSAIGNGIFQLFISDPRDETERFSDILGRLLDVPRFLEKMLERLDTPVQRWVDVDIAQTSGLPSLFETILNRAKAIDWTQAPELEIAIKRANEALGQYTTDLKTLGCTDHFHVGPEIARKIVEHRELSFLSKKFTTLREISSHANETIEALRTSISVRNMVCPGTPRPSTYNTISINTTD